MAALKGKTVFITGGTRGIGHAIGLRFAADGANVAICAKTVEAHPKLPGTISSAAEDMTKAGGHGLGLRVDVREEAQVRAAVAKTVETFGGIDVLINNASAIQLTGTLDTDMKRYDLMHQINTRGTFLASQACLPHLLKAANPHVVNLSPPLNMSPRWFGNHVAYTMAKYGMSLCVLGMAEEFKGRVAFNALWPKTTIATAAIRMLSGDKGMAMSRKPEIMADAAQWIVSQPAKTYSGNFLIDEDVLRGAGVSDMEVYAMVPGGRLQPDLFL